MEQSTKSSWSAFRREVGKGYLRLRAETWLAEMKVEADAALVGDRRKEETLQVGWIMFSQDRLGHYVTRFGISNPHNSALEERWRRQEKRAALSRPIMIKPL